MILANPYTPAQRDRALDALKRAMYVVESLPVVTPCAECLFFTPETAVQLPGFCDKWNAVVPAEHREAGCDKWQEGIPF